MLIQNFEQKGKNITDVHLLSAKFLMRCNKSILSLILKSIPLPSWNRNKRECYYRTNITPGGSIDCRFFFCL